MEILGRVKAGKKTTDPKQIEMLINKLDKDGNGTISLDELKSAE